MQDKAAFFTTVRTRMKGLKPTQVQGIETCLTALDGAPLAYAAYALATAWHETNATMEPVREAYWLSEAWRKDHLRYYPWYGRGFVQLTWEQNYAKADDELHKAMVLKSGESLLITPDLAMRPDVAAFVMRRGMEEGWFTGVKFSSVLPAVGVATRTQYMNARTIINGRDKADLVEDYAQVFERALRDGGWA